MTELAWRISEGDGPIIATAIHAGHSLRPEVAALTALTDEQRLREEDPFTDRWATTRVPATPVHSPVKGSSSRSLSASLRAHRSRNPSRIA